MTRDRIELDLHRLELRFADSRLVEPRAVARLAESIERCGQIVPCVVVAAPQSQMRCGVQHWSIDASPGRRTASSRPRPWRRQCPATSPPI